jgi:hypothetical protein
MAEGAHIFETSRKCQPALLAPGHRGSVSQTKQLTAGGNMAVSSTVSSHESAGVVAVHCAPLLRER